MTRTTPNSGSQPLKMIPATKNKRIFKNRGKLEIMYLIRRKLGMGSFNNKRLWVRGLKLSIFCPFQE